jgi:hypothetical protein
MRVEVVKPRTVNRLEPSRAGSRSVIDRGTGTTTSAQWPGVSTISRMIADLNVIELDVNLQ